MSAGSDFPTTAELGSFDAMTADSEPWDYYERLRELGEVVWDEEQKVWLITSYDVIKEVALEDHVTWRSPRVYDEERPPFGMTSEEWVRFRGFSRRAIHMLEGPEYDAQHRWWFRIFSPKVLAHWGDTLIEPIANAQIDRLLERGHAELRSEYVEQISPRVMTAIPGLPWADGGWYDEFIALHHRWIASQQFQAGTDPPRELVDDGLLAAKDMSEMLLPHVNAKRSGTGTDFISMVWRDADQLFGDDYTEFDVLSTALAAFVPGGPGSASSTSGNGLYLLLTRPGLRDQIVEGGERALKNFVEETLRLHSGVEWRPRRAMRDAVVAGVPIKEGELVVAVNAAGSRDPRRYGCPHSVDLERSAPRDHFGFYMGPRTCPGQSLGRFQLERIFAVTCSRLQNLRLDPEAPPPRYLGMTVRRWEPLHALFEPAA